MLTPTQAQDLVDWAGGQRAVERYTDGLITQSILWRWLNPERANERRRHWYAKNAEQQREVERHRKDKLRVAGLCTSCGKPKLSELYCGACLDKKNERGREYYHRAWGGAYRQRKQRLAAQRADVQSRLVELQKEREAISDS